MQATIYSSMFSSGMKYFILARVLKSPTKRTFSVECGQLSINDPVHKTASLISSQFDPVSNETGTVQ